MIRFVQAPFAVALLAAAILVPGRARASDYADFRDWHVACDNLRNCVATGGDGAGEGAYLRIARGGAADAAPSIAVVVSAEAGQRFTLRFNEAALPGLPDTPLEGAPDASGGYRRVVLSDTASAAALIAAFRKADGIRVTRMPAPRKDSHVSETSDISLLGLVASLLWMDDEQKRVDTVTALIRPGSKPASAIPPRSAEPVVVRPRPTLAKIPDKTPPSLIRKGRALCEEEDPNSKLEQVYPLAGNQLLYMFSCPDSSGAYNAYYGMLAAPAGKPQAARALSFAWPVQVGDTVHDADEPMLVTNPLFDPKTGTLTTLSKGRGLGDCGTGEEWLWDGTRFRLVQLKMMVHCRGIPYEDWPILYRAAVK